MANINKRSAFTKIFQYVSLKGIPGPRGRLFLKYVNFFQLDILGAFTRVNRIYGDIASFPWPMNSVIVYSPDMFKKILVDENRSYIKGEQIEEIRAVVGDGLATNNNLESWIKSRKLLAKEFNQKSVEKFFDIFIEETKKSMEISIESEIDICETMKKLTFDIACKTILGKGLSEEDARKVNEAVEYTSVVTYERIFKLFPLPYWLPTVLNRKFNHHFDNLNNIVLKIIAEERTQEKQEKLSILQKLVYAKDDESGFSYSNLELRDEILTLLLAGHETSAHTLAWIFGLLAKHQITQEHLYSELRICKNIDDILMCKALDNIIKESMRLYPAFPVLSRKAKVDVKLGAYSIKKNTNVVLPIYVTHRSPLYWDQPESFIPERFENEQAEKGYNYLPFARGPRRCIAEIFAINEMKIIISEYVKKYKLVLTKKGLPDEVAYVSLKPDNGMKLRLMSR